jgi:BirA family biotin operon repressor/biotin-[acetyl-CoA-carboxylase] ligase
MDLLHRLATQGAEEGTVVVAEEQLAGRGSRGRSWYSPRGGLWVSVLLRPAAGTEVLSLRVGLAAEAAVECLSPGLPLGIKWPNDLMLGDRKLGGVLCEARWAGDAPAWVIAGIGINVRNPIPQSLAGAAVALGEALPGSTAEHLLEHLLPRLHALDDTAPHLSEAELTRLAQRDWLRGRRVIRPVEGWADGIEADGGLRIRQDQGIVTLVRAGSVQLAEPSRSP